MEGTEFHLVNGTNYCPDSSLKLINEDEKSLLIKNLINCKNITVLLSKIVFKTETNISCFSPMNECSDEIPADTFALCNTIYLFNYLWIVIPVAIVVVVAGLTASGVVIHKRRKSAKVSIFNVFLIFCVVCRIINYRLWKVERDEESGERSQEQALIPGQEEEQEVNGNGRKSKLIEEKVVRLVARRNVSS